MLRKEVLVKFWKISVAGVGMALALAACGGGGSSSNGGGGGGCSQTGGASAGTTAAQTVKINPDPNTVGAYAPQTVTVHTGDSVEWDWEDSSSQHSVTADDNSFESCLQSAGSKFVVTFSKAGDFKYHCSIHSGMTGDVKVS
jgi:plastocyanin